MKIVFGYVKVRRGDLRVKEYEFYRAVYCGLCHHQKKLSRRLRYSLSYDMVLLALIRLGVTGERACFQKKRCPIHPLKGCLTVDASESLRYTASVSAILLYEKLRDDISDERGIRRLCARLMARGADKAMKHAPIPALAKTVSEKLSQLSTCEANGSQDVYEGAACFGALLGEVFCYDGGHILSDEVKAALYEIGYRVGRFIYILDAYADRVEDRKKGRYNPLVLSGEDLEDEAFCHRLVTALDLEMVEASRTLDGLSVKDRGIYEILDNLLRLGLPDVSREIIYQKKRVELLRENRKEDL
ncbi:MAG: hypothetical protein IKC63_01680 [Clostridia bacterium]|nr:hypothetical protein [Clostridia bacterium]